MLSLHFFCQAVRLPCEQQHLLCGALCVHITLTVQILNESLPMSCKLAHVRCETQSLDTVVLGVAVVASPWQIQSEAPF